MSLKEDQEDYAHSGVKIIEKMDNFLLLNLNIHCAFSLWTPLEDCIQRRGNTKNKWAISFR